MSKKYEADYLRKAHEFSMNNYKKLMEDDGVCGCFSCCSIFRPHEIKKIIIDEEETAVCPFCFEEAVIGSYSKFPITREFLEAMNDHWFGGNKETCRWMY